MRPVISVSLSGRAYQLEDDAHGALAQYLESAERALAENPDRAEVMADLEQAIADKCERFLGPHKNVVTRGEIVQVIHAMGPVDSGTAADGGHGASGENGAQDAGAAADAFAAAHQAGAASAAPRRLYQISDGALLSGVCKGLAEYFAVDVTLVRVLFVAAAVLTGGLAIFAYVVMMFIVPYANTPEERAAARGVPFNARVLVEQAKLKAAQLADAAAHAARSNGSRAARAQWKAEWRNARAQWRHEWRRSRAQWRAEWRARRWGGPPPGGMPPAPPVPLPPLTQLLSALAWAFLGILVVLVSIGWLLALFSLVTTGAVFGWMPFQMPFWVAVIALLVVYQLVLWPLRAIRHTRGVYVYGYVYRLHAFWDSLIGLALLALIVWLLAHHQHDVRQFFDSLQSRVQPAWHALLAGPPTTK